MDEAKEIGEAGGEGKENNHPLEPQAFRDFALQVGWWLQRKDSMTLLGLKIKLNHLLYKYFPTKSSSTFVQKKGCAF